MRCTTYFLCLTLFVYACGAGTDAITEEPAADNVSTADAIFDLVAQELVEKPDIQTVPDFVPDFAVPDESAEDVQPIDAVILWDLLPEFVDPCGETPYPFGCECTDDLDCQGGFCVQSWSGNVCTTTCTEECPEGFACSLIVGSCPDCQYLCMPLFVHLCRPCITNNDCQGDEAATGDLCVEFGPKGSFCGAACSGIVECPDGYSCKHSDVVGGIKSYQCVPDNWVCDCTDLAITQGAATQCSVENDSGMCMGTRMCQAEGLTECNAQVPEMEICNGVDDNCNGAVDEDLGGQVCMVDNEHGECEGTDLCVGGMTLCDAPDPAPEFCDGLDNNCDGQVDENSLDSDDDGQANCIDEDDDNDQVGDQLDNCPLAYNPGQEDNDFDLLGDVCDPDDDNDLFADDEDCQPEDQNSYPGANEFCDGKDNDCDLWVDEETCEDGNLCTTDVCDPVQGCLYNPNTNPCDDGNPCSGGDTCADGECVAGPNVCPCLQDADCADSGFAGGCLGAIYCDVTSTPTQCKVDPAGAVPCPASDDPCKSSSCDPVTGQCVFTDASEGSACEDGEICTVGDQCVVGQCMAGDNLCECELDGDCAAHEDGNLCNGTLVCDTSGVFPVCKLDSGTIIECAEPENPCKEAACDPVQGQCLELDVENQTPCDDHSVCTVNEMCFDGECSGGNQVKCNDGNSCTADQCDPEVGCLHNVLSGFPCSDGDFCTSGDECQQGICVGGQTLTCDDGNPCTDDSCDQDVGCVHTPNIAPCDDGNECTVGDQCGDGLCKAASMAQCDDDESCTFDTCDPQAGCVHTPQDVPCNDGDWCTVVDECVLGHCVGAGSPDCEDGNLCTADSCVKAQGCVHLPNVEPCDDGDECTTQDVCSNKQCTGGPPLLCEDNDDCTDDSCDPDSGCVNMVNTDFNSDELNCGECGNICPEFTVCQGGDCVLLPGQPCDVDGSCMSGFCRLDFDDDGMFCAQDAVSCVYALGGAVATQVSPGGKMCGGTTGHRTCSAGIWTNTVECAGASCDGTVHLDPQTCTDGQGCAPDPQVETQCAPYACSADGCLQTCQGNDDCAQGHICNNGDCSQGQINQPGSIRQGSEYYGEVIPGFVQCAGWKNTSDWDILTTNWIHSCARNSGQMRFRLYDAGGSVVLDETFPNWTQTEMSNNLPGCGDSGYGVCGKGGGGKFILIYKPNNGNGGCHGDDNSQGAVRITNNINGDTSMGDNYVFLGGKLSGGGYRDHNFGETATSEIRWLGGSLWDGCNHDGRATNYGIAVYVTQ